MNEVGSAAAARDHEGCHADSGQEKQGDAVARRLGDCASRGWPDNSTDGPGCVHAGEREALERTLSKLQARAAGMLAELDLGFAKRREARLRAT